MSQETDKTRSDGAAIDRVALLESVRGKVALLHRIIGVFLEEYKELLHNVDQAIQNKEAKSLERAAHRLNGTLIAMTASAASAPAHKLEKMGRAEDMADASPTYELLATRVEQLVVELRAMVAEGVPPA